MDGQVVQQSSSYRQGLVLGLTMAEVILLLIFCLLIAMVSFIRHEQTERASIEAQLRDAQNRQVGDGKSQDQHEKAIAHLQNQLRERNEMLDRMRREVGGASKNAPDEFWRELVESNELVQELKREGLTLKDIRERVAEGTILERSGVKADEAKRNADIVARGIAAGGPAGHQWPPIIKLSEADGHYFKSGSAELSQEFRRVLLDGAPEKILEIIRKYQVDVIEVVGHTDEQPLAARQSNLDRDLVPVLKNSAGVGKLTPADNAGLGLARAVSVLSVLRQSKLLDGYKLIPLSGAQLIENDETLALSGSPGDVRERRRIEIRLRKSVPQEATVRIAPKPNTALPAKQPRPAPPRPSTAPSPPAAAPSAPFNLNIFRWSN